MSAEDEGGARRLQFKKYDVQCTEGPMLVDHMGVRVGLCETVPDEQVIESDSVGRVQAELLRAKGRHHECQWSREAVVAGERIRCTCAECASPYLDLAFPPSNYPSSAHFLMLKKFKKRYRRSDHEAQPQDEGVHDNFPLIHRDSPFRW